MLFIILYVIESNITNDIILNLLQSKDLGVFSGAIFFKEFGLIILSPPTGIIDVLSMGEYKPTSIDMEQNSNLYKVKGAYHSVFNNKFTNMLHSYSGKLFVIVDLNNFYIGFFTNNLCSYCYSYR